MVNTTENLENGTAVNLTVCGARFSGQDTSETFGVDLIMGDAFLRNAYVSYVSLS